MTVSVKNTSGRDGEEVVQLYASYPDSKVERPSKQLRAFKRIPHQAGESREVTLTVPKEELGYWNEEKQMFLEDLGLKESGCNRLIKAIYSLLNLETFITAGEMEVKAWTYRKGWKAPQCAGVIHTDFEKGFIRAEVIKYEDYIKYGSEAAVREAGKLGVEGKEYVVQDGDIMHFRFNV